MAITFISTRELAGRVKQASVAPSSLDICRQIMRSVYEENPTYWPYGLSVESHDGGLYLVWNEQGKPVGFVGWQVRPGKDGMSVGYYTIGMLPEYRGQAYAKEALQTLLEIKAGTVDQVKAFIVPGNHPSIGLAKSLGIPIRHTV